MKQLVIMLTAALTLALPALTLAQSRPDFSGSWVFNQGKSTKGTGGNTPVVTFPSEMVIKQTAGELHVEGSTMRQDAITAVYKFDGSEVTVGMPAGITEKARAAWDGNRLVITSKRSVSSIVGDIVTDFRETWSLAGNVLTIEKTRIAEGLSDTERAVFEK